MKANRLLDLATGFCSQAARAFRRVTNVTGLLLLPISLAAALAAVSDDVLARKTCDDGSYPPCTSEGEAASNNLSYPVIWSDGIVQLGFVQNAGAWIFATVVDPPTECVGEDDILPPNTVPDDVLCYYGRQNLGFTETGERIWGLGTRTWWLQQRQPANQWQVFNTVDPDVSSPVVVTGVDTGDLLESSITIKAKQIRTEFTLLKHVGYNSDPAVEEDADFSGYRLDNGCLLDPNDLVSDTSPSNCFAAHSMSGAVPGTDQSIAETQGTEFPGGEVLLDPRDVKQANNYFDPDLPALGAFAVTESSEEPNPAIEAIDPPLGMDATVYSVCARLIIQKITGDVSLLYWDSDQGRWGPASEISANWVDIKAWDNTYSAEINAGGSLIYGYNWNTKNFSEGSGTYRLTFVLEGERCPYPLNTVFDDTTMSVNVGERRPATVLSSTELGGHHGEGGAVYVDVDIVLGGGGGKKPKPN